MDAKYGRLQALLDSATIRSSVEEKEVSECFLQARLRRHSCGIYLMIVKRPRTCSIIWMMLSLQPVDIRTIWRFYSASWLPSEIPLKVIVKVYQTPSSV